jgi:hypothetical protein
MYGDKIRTCSGTLSRLECDERILRSCHTRILQVDVGLPSWAQALQVYEGSVSQHPSRWSSTCCVFENRLSGCRKHDQIWNTESLAIVVIPLQASDSGQKSAELEIYPPKFVIHSCSERNLITTCKVQAGRKIDAIFHCLTGTASRHRKECMCCVAQKTDASVRRGPLGIRIPPHQPPIVDFVRRCCFHERANYWVPLRLLI